MTLPAQDKQLEAARVALLAARTDPALAGPLAELGFTAAKVADGWALYEDAAQAVVVAAHLRAEQLQATRSVRDLRREVRSEYNSAAGVARVVFSDSPDAFVALNLSKIHKRGPKRHRHKASESASESVEPTTTDEMAGDLTSNPAGEANPIGPANPIEPTPDTAEPVHHKRRLSQSDSAWCDRAGIFYTNAVNVADIGTALAEVGYSADRLQAAGAAVKRFELAVEDRRIKRIKAGVSYRARREKIQALRVWLARFNAILTAAWHDRPDLLDKLGLKPRGRRRAA